MNANMTRWVAMALGMGLLLFAGTAAAQRQLAGTRSPPELVANPAQAQAAFEQYQKSGRNSAAAQGQLIQILNGGLPRTAANTTAIQTLLAATSDPTEKIGLIRLLAAQYEQTSASPRNDLIIRDLRLLATSSDKDVARAATFAFCRLGFLPGFEDVLGHAFKTSLITNDDYFGEIAHALATAPAGDQARLARQLRESRNRYAAEIVAMGINSARPPATWATETRAEFALLLESTQPVFTQSPGRYDVQEAVQYANWLNALAIVRASVLNREGAEFILGKLNDPGTDPRKAMAFLGSAFALRLYQLIGEKARFRIVLERMSLASKQHPQNLDMQEAVGLVTARIAQMTR